MRTRSFERLPQWISIVGTIFVVVAAFGIGFTVSPHLSSDDTAEETDGVQDNDGMIAEPESATESPPSGDEDTGGDLVTKRLFVSEDRHGNPQGRKGVTFDDFESEVTRLLELLNTELEELDSKLQPLLTNDMGRRIAAEWKDLLRIEVIRRELFAEQQHFSRVSDATRQQLDLHRDAGQRARDAGFEAPLILAETYNATTDELKKHLRNVMTQSTQLSGIITSYEKKTTDQTSTEHLPTLESALDNLDEFRKKSEFK